MTNTAAKRGGKRRTEDEMIADLEAKIQAVKDRVKTKEVKASPVHKDFERFKKHAAKFIQSCVEHGRQDAANSLLGIMNVLERQVQEVPED